MGRVIDKLPTTGTKTWKKQAYTNVTRLELSFYQI